MRGCDHCRRPALDAYCTRPECRRAAWVAQREADAQHTRLRAAMRGLGRYDEPPERDRYIWPDRLTGDLVRELDTQKVRRVWWGRMKMKMFPLGLLTP